jgi:hypothetical protein
MIYPRSCVHQSSFIYVYRQVAMHLPEGRTIDLLLSVPQFCVILVVVSAGSRVSVPISTVCKLTGIAFSKITELLTLLTSPAHPVLMVFRTDVHSFQIDDLVEYNISFDPPNRTDEDDPFIVSSMTADAQVTVCVRYVRPQLMCVCRPCQETILQRCTLGATS